MENKFNIIFLVTLLLFFPMFAEGKSLIEQVKERITKEAEKIEEKKEEKKSAEEESRIKEVKDKIVKEKKKEEYKVEVKGKEKKKEEEKEKDKDKYNHDYVNDYKNKNDHDYAYDNDGIYHKKKYKYDYYSDNDLLYRIYDNISFDVIYDDYTYIDDSDLISPSPIYTDKHPRKIAFLNSSVEAAYLGKDIDDTYGVTAKISANLYNLHFNCFYQSIFSSEESLTLYSINGGFSFSVQNVTFTPFLGAFYIEPLEEARFSYGVDLQVFLPDNYNLDLYTLNSSYGSLNFNNFSASLNHAFYRFNVGLGFNYNDYAGVSFSGPLVKLSFWL